MQAFPGVQGAVRRGLNPEDNERGGGLQLAAAGVVNIPVMGE